MTDSPSRLDRYACILGWGLVAAWVVLSSISEGATRVFHWPWTFYAQISLLAPGLLLGWQWLRRERPTRSLLSVVAVAAAGTLLSVALSRNPAFSFEVALLPLGGLAATLWITRLLTGIRDNELRFLRLASVIGLAALIPLLACLGYFLEDALPRWPEGLLARNRHPFGHWNYTAGYILLVVPWLIALAWHGRGIIRIGWIAATTLALGLLWTCHSRGAALGTMVAIALVIAWRFQSSRLNRRQTLLVVLTGAIACGVLLFTNERLRSYLAAPETVFNPNEGDVQRLAMLEGGWRLFRSRPVLGHGPGIVPLAYPEVRGELVGGVETSFQLHSTPLHIMATQGLLGLGAFAVLLALVGLGAWRWWRAPSGPIRNFALTSVCALAAYGVMSLTDYQLDVIGIVVLLAWHAALLLAAPKPGATPMAEFALASVRRSRLPGIGLLAATLAAALLLVPHWQARALHWQATFQRETDAQLRLLEASAQAAPWSPHFRNQHGFRLARLAEEFPSEKRLREAARASLELSLAIEPAQEPVHAALGWLWLPDNPANAKKAFTHAIRLLPDRPTNRFGLALALLALGESDNARHALAVECLVYPAFLLSPHWHAPGLMTVRDDVLARIDELYAAALRHPAVPRWRLAPVRYSRALAAWIITNTLPDPESLASATPEQRAFFAACTAGSDAKWPAPWDSWERLRDAPGQAAAILQATRPGLDPVVIQAAEARFRLDAPAPIDLVRTLAPAGLPVMTTAFERGHYSLMHRSSDDTWYPDLGPRVMDALSTLYLQPLLPDPGIIPAPVLLDLDTPTVVAAP
jgi:uncharacterized protein involved in response to NO